MIGGGKAAVGVLSELRTFPPARTAVRCEDGDWSATELWCAADRVSSDLCMRGMRPGHRIAVVLPAGRAALATLLGAMGAGGFVALLSPTLGPEARRYRIEAFRPEIVIDQDHGPADGPQIDTPPACPGNGGRLVLWTSGSTGLPRGIVHEWQGILWNARSNATELRLVRDDRALVLLDAAYCYALVHQILSHLIVGGSVAIPPQPAWLEATGRFIERFEATTLAVVPSILRSLLALPRLHTSLRRLRLLTVGGAAVDEALLRVAQEALPGVQIVVTYGLTEAGPRVATRFVKRSEDVSAGTVGHVLPGVDLRIGGDGGILVRSPSVRVGVLNDGMVRHAPEWLDTGDLGEMCADGTLRVLSRRRPMINRGGSKLAPGEIERILLGVPGVAEARVVAMPHARLGEVPRAFIVPLPGAPPEPRVLARRCLDELGAAWVPTAFNFVPTLPRAVSSWKDVP